MSFNPDNADRLRHRDRMLSLKYSTIEACFSVPMLNITLPTFPFVVAFAVKGLGWGAGAIGLMTALPHLCNCVQPPLVAALARRYSNYSVMRLTFIGGGLAWLLAPLLGLADGTSRDALFAFMLLLGTLANSVAAVAWSASISEVVPPRLGGRYFARRNLIYGAWTLAAVLAAGELAERGGHSLLVFGWVFFAAGTLRLMGWFFTTRMHYPPEVKQVQGGGVSPPALKAVLRDRNYLRLCVGIGLWGLLLNAAMPFYTVFLVDRLGCGVGDVVILTTVASLGGLVTLRSWGRLCERFGCRSVLQVSGLIWGATALVMWTLARPGLFWHLYVGYFIVGAMTAGFQLMQFNLMIRLASPDLRSAYVAVFLALTSLLTALGPLAGSQVLKLAPDRIGTFLGHPFTQYHLLFAAAALGCMAATFLFRRVTEPVQQSVRVVWREMAQMRAFNPMLSLLAVGQLLLTPEGLYGFAQRSLRVVRQQARALESVGEEIVLGGRKMLGKTRPRTGL